MSVRPGTDVPMFDADWRPEDGAQLDLFTGAVAARPGPPCDGRLASTHLPPKGPLP